MVVAQGDIAQGNIAQGNIAQGNRVTWPAFGGQGRITRGVVMGPALVEVGPAAVPTHDLFVGLGVLVALVTFAREVRRRHAWNEALLVVVAGTLVGGAVGMRLAGVVHALAAGGDLPLWQAWLEGTKSILGGLSGAYVGALVGKRLGGYRGRTGDLFAPAVALGMAVGRVGCLLTETPGRPTSLPWAFHGRHPSFAYEIAFHLLAFVALARLRPRITAPGELLPLYLTAYAGFRFLVELTRANDVLWLGLTGPQWFLLATTPLLCARVAHQWSRGSYAAVFPARPHAQGARP